MKRSRFTETRSIGILKVHEAGVPVADPCRKHGVSDATVYKWKARFGGMDVSQGRQCCAIGPNDNRGASEEGAQRRERPPEPAAGRCDVRQCGTEGPARKKVLTPAVKRQAVTHLVAGHGMSERRACLVIGCCRMTMRYQAIRQDDPVLRERLKELARVRRRFGYLRLHVFLRRRGVSSTTSVCSASIARMADDQKDRFPDDTACPSPRWAQAGHRHAGPQWRCR